MREKPNAQASGTPVVSAKLFDEEFFVEADQDHLAPPNGGRPQIAGWAQHRIEERLVRLTRGLERAHFLSLGDEHRGSPLGDFRCVSSPQLAAGENGFLCVDAICVQELGRSRTRSSALAGVEPVDAPSHGVAPLLFEVSAR